MCADQANRPGLRTPVRTYHGHVSPQTPAATSGPSWWAMTAPQHGGMRVPSRCCAKVDVPRPMPQWRQFPWPYPSGSSSRGASSHGGLQRGDAQLASSGASDRAHSHGQLGFENIPLPPGLSPVRWGSADDSTPASSPGPMEELPASPREQPLLVHLGEPSDEELDEQELEDNAAEVLAQQLCPRRKAVPENASEDGDAAAVAAADAQEGSGTRKDPMNMTGLGGNQPSHIVRRSRTPIDRRLAYDEKGYTWPEFRSWYGDHAHAFWQTAPEDPLAEVDWAWLMLQVNVNRSILKRLQTRETPRMQRLIANCLPSVPDFDAGGAASSGGFQASANSVLESFAHSYE